MSLHGFRHLLTHHSCLWYLATLLPFRLRFAQLLLVPRPPPRSCRLQTGGGAMACPMVVEWASMAEEDLVSEGDVEVPAAEGDVVVPAPRGVAAGLCPLYPQFRARCAPSSEATERIRGQLDLAEIPNSSAFADGTRLTVEGTQSVIPHVQELVSIFRAELIVSDSMLCTVDRVTGSADRAGLVARTGISVPVRPAWGRGFARDGFRQATWYAWQEFRACTKMLLLVAGNDLDRIRGSSASHVHEIIGAMDSLTEEWRNWGVEIVYIDCVPRSYHLV